MKILKKAIRILCIIVGLGLIIGYFAHKVPFFKTGDCIYNKINNKVGLILGIEEESYIVRYTKETYNVPIAKQVNYDKVYCHLY